MHPFFMTTFTNITQSDNVWGWMIEAKIHFGTPWKSSLNCQILILFVFWLSSWLIVKAIWVHLWPKSNLRPVFWWHRSPLGCHKSQNMLTTALFLMQDDVKHPVEMSRYSEMCARVQIKRLRLIDNLEQIKIRASSQSHTNGVIRF